LTRLGFFIKEQIKGAEFFFCAELEIMLEKEKGFLALAWE
jgi:hypothetical protein